MRITIITIKGTHCASCKAVIEDVAGDIPGVVDCAADFETGRVEVRHEDGLDWRKFKEEIEALGGYKVLLLTASSPEQL